MSIQELTSTLKERGFLSDFQVQLLADLRALGNCDEGEAAWILALLIATAGGSLCISAGSDTERRRELLAQSLDDESLNTVLSLLDRGRIRHSAIVGHHSEGDIPTTPLILSGDGFLFFHSHYFYRQRLLASVRAQEASSQSLVSEQALEDGLRAMLQTEPPPTAEQVYAVYLAATRPLSLITGGPGSGKTSTVHAILKLLLSSGLQPREIAIAAPTGRAASRVQESLAERSDPELQSLLEGISSSTIHRLLGAGRNGFYFDRWLKLRQRVIILDELSMVDVALMGRLLDAVDLTTTSLILIGDPDQLPSVEAGAVLQDFLSLSGSAEQPRMRAILDRVSPEQRQPGMQTGPSHSVFLHGSHRFGGDIADFAARLRKGDLDEGFLRSHAVASLDAASGEGLFLIEEPSMPTLLQTWCSWIQSEGESEDPQDLLDRVNRYRILVPVRKGPGGVEAINEACARIYEHPGLRGGPDWFAGMPLMIHRNDNSRRLYNGDTGVVVERSGSAELVACFPGTSAESVRYLGRESLPQHERAFAHTIHKSQGSEYETVLILLGPQNHDSFLNRQLLYTAITRAKKRCIICGEIPLLLDAAMRQPFRETGLLPSDTPALVTE
ncbi:MAG: exodeoxyribonuclease V subunit alpha [Leptospiraceae bacterium]|nr:exodeoxyribonuclease V subunit alpha [Leptospiraceae bacterium]